MYHIAKFLKSIQNNKNDLHFYSYEINHSYEVFSTCHPYTITVQNCLVPTIIRYILPCNKLFMLTYATTRTSGLFGVAHKEISRENHSFCLEKSWWSQGKWILQSSRNHFIKIQPFIVLLLLTFWPDWSLRRNGLSNRRLPFGFRANKLS